MCLCKEPLLFPQKRKKEGKKTPLPPQASVPLPKQQCMNCCEIEMNLTFRKKKENVAFYSAHSLYVSQWSVTDWHKGAINGMGSPKEAAMPPKKALQS